MDNDIFILIIGILIIILLFKLFTCKNSEHFTDAVDDYVDQRIKNIFQIDVDATRNLDSLLQSINSNTSINLPIDTVNINNIILNDNISFSNITINNNNIRDIIINTIYPVNSIYVQFPHNNTNDIINNDDPNKDIKTAFPLIYSPQVLFGGRWLELYKDEDSIFFRTIGNLSNENRINGFQDYAMKHLYGNTSYIQADHQNQYEGIQTDSVGNAVVGSLISDKSTTIFADKGSGDSNGIQLDLDTSKANLPLSNEFKVKNRLFKIWKKIGN